MLRKFFSLQYMLDMLFDDAWCLGLPEGHGDIELRLADMQ